MNYTISIYHLFSELSSRSYEMPQTFVFFAGVENCICYVALYPRFRPPSRALMLFSLCIYLSVAHCHQVSL